MRNLKRALSLTLASVMLLGMMVVGTSAASYPDVDAEDNVEAIEVVQAVGVMVGDEQGNFNPGTQVTRNEMAVIMAKLILGPDLAETYVGICPFWDVPDWAQKYVAACYDNGIVAGIGGGAYGGDQTVTAEQAAAMMLRALGYSKLTDDSGDWARPVVAQASRIQLFNGVGTNPKETLTRNQVAQLTLNTLESGTVEMQDNTMNITGGNSDISFNITGGQVSYVYITSNDNKYNHAINNLGATSIGSENGGLIVELGEKLYNGDLKLEDDDVDDFGRPSRSWTYKNDSVGTYAKKTELIATYTAKVTKGDIYGLLSSSVRSNLEKTSDGSTLTVTVDGQKIKNGNTNADADTWYVRNSSAAIYTFGGVIDSTRNGTLTEVYLDSDNNVDIVIINTYVYQATSDYSATRDDVKMAPAGDPVLVLKAGELTLNGEDFNITDIKTDDYLLITAASEDGTAYEVKSVQVAEKVTGEVTGYANQSSVTIDGTTYTYSATCEKNGSTGVRDTQYTVGQDAIVVLDAYGYIIAVDEAVSSSSFVFIKDFGGTSGLNTKAVADAYFTDGTNDEITIDRVDTQKNATTISNWGTGGVPDYNYICKWYTYSINSDGKYVLYSIAPSGRSNDSGSYTNNDPANALSIVVNGRVDFMASSVTAGTAGIANDKTIMIVKDTNGDVSVYTGTANIPDINLPKKTGVAAPSATVYYATNSKGYAEYAFVDLTGTGASVVDGGDDTSFLYVLRLGDTLSGANATKYYTYSTINPETGAEEKVSFDSKYFNGVPSNYDGGDHPYQLRYKPRYNSDERITSLTEIPDGWNPGSLGSDRYFNRAITGDQTITFSNGSLKIGADSFIVADSKISLVIVKDSSTQSLLADKGANHEFYFETQAQTVASLLEGYAVTGNIAGATKSATSSVIDTLYITVTHIGPGTPTDSNGISDALNDPDAGAEVKVENVTLDTGVSVPDGKTLVLSGNVAGGSQTISQEDSSGAVELNGAAVSGTLTVSAPVTLTGTTVNGTLTATAAATLSGTVTVAAEKTLTLATATINGTVSVGADADMTVTTATLNGTIKLADGAELTIGTSLTAGSGASIEADAGAQLTVPAGLTDTLKAVVAPANFYEENGTEMDPVPAGTYEYREEGWNLVSPLSRAVEEAKPAGWYAVGGGSNEGTAAVKAVYDSGTVTVAPLGNATNTITVGGQNITVSSSDTIDELVAALGSNASLSGVWTIAKDGDDAVKFTAKVAGALDSTGAPTTALAAGLTKVTDGEDAVAATATVEIAAEDADNADISDSVTGVDLTDSSNDSGTEDDFTWVAVENSDGSYTVTLSSTKTGSEGNGDTDGVTFADGEDAVAAVYSLTGVADKIDAATSSSATLTIGGFTATVTEVALADQLDQFIAQYTADSSNEYVVTLNDAEDGIKFTAKNAGAIGQSGPTAAPAGATEVTAGAEAVPAAG